MKHAWLALAALAGACAPSAADAPIPEQWRAVNVTTERIDFGVETIGLLHFRGGVSLSSDRSNEFGGLSDIEVLDDGRFIAISDNGIWFEGRLVLDDAGALAGVEGVRMAYMRDENAVGFPTKATGDAEDLAQLPDGRLAVSFEQTQSIRLYDFNRDGPFGAAARGPVLDGIAGLQRNVGLEAIASTAGGGLVVGAEGGERATTPLWLAPLDAHAPTPPRIGYPLRTGYSLTGLDRLPDGGFVAIERFYAPIIGARARLTRFTAEALNARAESLPEVEELALLEPPRPLDNFEGVSAVRTADGGVRLYIVSDNNYNRRQRTLIYAFDVVSAEPPR